MIERQSEHNVIKIRKMIEEHRCREIHSCSYYGAESIVKKVVGHKHLGNGSIILCHNGAKFTVDALEAMILGLKEKGYEIVPIS